MYTDPMAALRQYGAVQNAVRLGAGYKTDAFGIHPKKRRPKRTPGGGAGPYKGHGYRAGAALKGLRSAYANPAYHPAVAAGVHPDVVRAAQLASVLNSVRMSAPPKSSLF